MPTLKPKAKPFLLSMLLRRFSEHRDQFLKDTRTPWLVWEHGPWKPPSADDVTADVPSLQLAEALATGSDLLCFQLLPVPGQSAAFRVGRDRGLDVTINDATVSRRHFELLVDAGGSWSIDAGLGGAVQHRGELAVPGQLKRMASRDEVQLGNVKLTFYLPEDWVKRVVKESNKRTSA